MYKTQKLILRRSQRLFCIRTNNYAICKQKPLRHKENHVKCNSLPCIVFRKSFRHTKQALKPHQA